MVSVCAIEVLKQDVVSQVEERRMMSSREKIERNLKFEDAV